MKKISLLVSIFFLTLSCNEKATEFKSVNVKDLYSIEIPANMKEAMNLNTEASLQYQNPYEEFYVIVLDETKESYQALVETDGPKLGLQEYTENLIAFLEQGVDNLELSEIDETRINGLKANLFSGTGIVEGFEVYYEFAYLKSEKNFYQIVTWTEVKRKGKHQENMKRIIRSFKEKGYNKRADRSRK